MMGYTFKQTKRRERSNGESRILRQQANYERFMQERADVFQVTKGKAQAAFWAMQNL